MRKLLFAATVAAALAPALAFAECDARSAATVELGRTILTCDHPTSEAVQEILERFFYQATPFCIERHPTLIDRRNNPRPLIRNVAL